MGLIWKLKQEKETKIFAKGLISFLLVFFCVCFFCFVIHLVLVMGAVGLVLWSVK